MYNTFFFVQLESLVNRKQEDCEVSKLQTSCGATAAFQNQNIFCVTSSIIKEHKKKTFPV